MSEQLVPLSEVAAILTTMLKQATPLDADTPAPGKVKDSADDTSDIKVDVHVDDKDVKLDNTDGTEAAKEMSEGLASTVDEYTSEGSQEEAVDESSAVITARGSQRGEPITEKEAAVKLDTDDAQTDFLSGTMESMLNDQLAFEMYSAYIYYAIAAWSNSKGLTGFYAWFKRQGDDEIKHAMKLMEYLIDTGSTLTFPAIKSPNELITFKSMEDATKAALKHEMEVTKRWQDIGERAKEDPNLATQQLAQWFMTEQVEEEDGAVTLHQRVQMADTGAGLLVLDNHLRNIDPGE